MKSFHVTSYYLATGMEGVPDTEDYGIIEADTKESAIEAVIMQRYPIDIMYGPNNAWSSRDFARGCLSAKEVDISTA